MFSKRRIGILFLSGFPIIFSGCLNTHHTVEANVKPIHVTLDVNLKVERELDNFFGDLDRENPLLDEDENSAPDSAPGNPGSSSSEMETSEQKS